MNIDFFVKRIPYIAFKRMRGRWKMMNTIILSQCLPFVGIRLGVYLVVRLWGLKKVERSFEFRNPFSVY